MSLDLMVSRDNLPKTMKNGAHVINLDEDVDVGTHWIALYVKTNEFTYFDSFGVEHVPKEINLLTCLFSYYYFKKNDDIILSYFK